MTTTKIAAVTRLELPMGRILAKNLDSPDGEVVGFILEIGPHAIAAVYTQGYDQSDTDQSIAIAEQLAPGFTRGPVVVLPVLGGSLKCDLPWIPGTVKTGAPSAEEAMSAIGLAYLAAKEEQAAPGIDTERLRAELRRWVELNRLSGIEKATLRTERDVARAEAAKAKAELASVAPASS